MLGLRKKLATIKASKCNFKSPRETRFQNLFHRDWSKVISRSPNLQSDLIPRFSNVIKIELPATREREREREREGERERLHDEEGEERNKPERS